MTSPWGATISFPAFSALFQICTPNFRHEDIKTRAPITTAFSIQPHPALYVSTSTFNNWCELTVAEGPGFFANDFSRSRNVHLRKDQLPLKPHRIPTRSPLPFRTKRPWPPMLRRLEPQTRMESIRSKLHQLYKTSLSDSGLWRPIDIRCWQKMRPEGNDADLSARITVV